MPDININTLHSDNGKIFIQVREQYISGDMMRSYDSLRIVRIDSIGNEPNFGWIINDKRYSPQEGDYLLFSGVDLRMPIISERPSTVRITVITFEPLTIFPHTELIGFFFMKNRTRHHILKNESKTVAESFNKVIEEIYRGDRYSKIAASSALLMLIVELCRTIGYMVKPNANPIYSQSSCELIGNIISYISLHFSEKLTVGSVAKTFNISESMLSKLMNGIFGVSFPEYVRRLRVNNVVRLIREKNMRVLDAAVESGFTSVAGFYKTFREITGTSPTDFCLDK
jgi:AraC-like DNA-binding protein